MTKRATLITHSGGFHADDVFATAALQLLLGRDAVEVMRTRDLGEIAKGDYVYDVGEVYDPESNRFDHHQKGGAGARDNGIPYAAFGLVWKEFGAAICGSQEIADAIEKNLVWSVDAYDNGVNLYEKIHPSGAYPLIVQGVISAFEPAWKEERTTYDAFLEAVDMARRILERLIAHAQGDAEASKVVIEAYDNAPDKRLVVVESGAPISRPLIASILAEHDDTLYFVRRHEDRTWQLICVPTREDFFAQRKPLPEGWAGKSGAELEAATGVPGSVFCHNHRFMIVAKEKENILKLAELALAA